MIAAPSGSPAAVPSYAVCAGGSASTVAFSRAPQILGQQFWRRRMQNDRANRWLRGVFHAVNRRDADARMPV